jgi:hypothetical protein
MLDDDLAAKAPLFQRLLVERALTLLNTFPAKTSIERPGSWSRSWNPMQ